MTDRAIYIVKGTRWENGEVYPELGEVKTRILCYATGDEREIRKCYSDKDYMEIDIEPVKVAHFEESKLEGALV